ncbi:MAG: type VII secretion protein EccB [Nocardioides alkalitolerans]
MATKRDLVEAYSFSRRRLVTAFVSGAPGGREVEPSRPGRAIIGGVAITVLVLAAAAVLGFIKPRPNAGWADSEGVVLAEDSVQLYLVQVGENGEDTVLVPIVNATSARLILGSDLNPTTVPEEEINKYEQADAIGIPEAPVAMPGGDALVRTGWTGCTTNGGGFQVAVASDPSVEVDEQAAMVVSSGGAYFLLAPGQPDANGTPRVFRMEIPSAEAAAELLEVLEGPVPEDVVEVPRDWVDLFPAAPPLGLDAFDFEGQLDQPGQGIEGLTLSNGNPALTGMLVLDRNGDEVVLTADGYREMSDFGAAVYRTLPNIGEPSQVTGDIGTRYADPAPNDVWPVDRPELRQDAAAQQPCVVLSTHDDVPPTVSLAFRPSAPAAAEGVGADKVRTFVERGSGAVVRVGGFTDTRAGDAFLVDSQGVRYALPGDALTQLGYGIDDAAVVPTAWIEHFGCGVTLTREEALRPIGSSAQADRTCPPVAPGEEAPAEEGAEAEAGAGG